MTPEDQALLERVPDEKKTPNGVPGTELAARRGRALELVREQLDAIIQPGGICISPLGPEWSTDIDVHVVSRPDPRPLESSGWINLDPILGRLGSNGSDRWAVTDGSRLLAAIDLHLTPPPAAVEGIVSRCRRRQEVRVREVLELRALARAGHDLPGNEVTKAAAGVEAALGGNELGRWFDGNLRPSPAPLGSSDLRLIVHRLRRGRRRRVIVALSGVDGAGKSTLVRAVGAELEAGGIPVSAVWTRPGLGLQFLNRVARVGKKVLGQDQPPGIRQVGRKGSRPLPSRRGLVGWVWSLFVTLSFLARVRQARLHSRGVVLFDRHLLDALATVDFAYQGVNLSLQRWLIRYLLPRADHTFYLDITAGEAIARKPDEVFGEHAVLQQLDAYKRLLDDMTEVQVLDALQLPEQLVQRVVGRILEP